MAESETAAEPRPTGTFVGVGGIGWGHFFAVTGNRTIGRNESRGAELVDARDAFKLQIVFHMLAVLTAARALGPAIVPIGVVGRDAAGRRLVREMQAVGMSVDFIRMTASRPTTFGVACQYPDGSGFNIGATNGAAETLAPVAIERIADRLNSLDRPIVAVCLPEVPLETRAAFLQRLEGPGVTRVASFATADIGQATRQGLIGNLDLLSLNEDEAAAVVGRPFDAAIRRAFLGTLSERLHQLNRTLKIVFTAGALGAFACDDGVWDHCPAPEVPITSTAGAGDALLAGVLAGRWIGLPLSTPARSGQPFARRGLASALDVGVLAASFKLGSRDTIPRETTRGAIARFGSTLGLSPSGTAGRLLAG